VFATAVNSPLLHNDALHLLLLLLQQLHHPELRAQTVPAQATRWGEGKGRGGGGGAYVAAPVMIWPPLRIVHVAIEVISEESNTWLR
jgi:hypothetical protein